MELKPEDKGREITCNIRKQPITGKIQYEKGLYYICHNDESFQGQNCRNKFGFKYSWTVNAGTTIDIRQTEVTNLRFTEPNKELSLKDVIKQEINNLRNI
jgi:hypothetical protein